MLPTTNVEIGCYLRASSRNYDIDLHLFASIAWHESAGGNAWAIRSEDAFFLNKLAARTRSQLAGFVPPVLPTLATEKRLRSHSFGMFQIMGETARVLGFKGQYLTELLDPETNIEYAAKYFKQCLNKSPDERTALLHWNGGGNLQYPDLVFAVRDSGAFKELLP